MALDHFIDDLLRRHRVVCLVRGLRLDVFLHRAQVVLQDVGVLELRQVVAAVKHIGGEGPASVPVESRRALAVDAMLGPRHVGQAGQVQLVDRVLEQ